MSCSISAIIHPVHNAHPGLRVCFKNRDLRAPSLGVSSPLEALVTVSRLLDVSRALLRAGTSHCCLVPLLMGTAAFAEDGLAAIPPFAAAVGAMRPFRTKQAIYQQAEGAFSKNKSGLLWRGKWRPPLLLGASVCCPMLSRLPSEKDD